MKFVEVVKSGTGFRFSGKLLLSVKMQFKKYFYLQCHDDVTTPLWHLPSGVNQSCRVSCSYLQ